MSPEVIAVCQQLLKEGKSVSTGMLKSRLPGKTPFTEIVKAVQYCKQNPSAITELKPSNSSATKKTPSSDAERIQLLEQRIKLLEQRLSQLEQNQSY